MARPPLCTRGVVLPGESPLIPLERERIADASKTHFLVVTEASSEAWSQANGVQRIDCDYPRSKDFQLRGVTGALGVFAEGAGRRRIAGTGIRPVKTPCRTSLRGR